MNLPNKLTIFRIILVPVMVLIPLLSIRGDFFNIPYEFLIMDVIFIIASITDKLDGYIARSRNLVTTFGKFLDPLADKILVISAMVILVEKNMLPAIIPIIVIAREFIVSGYRMIAASKNGEVIAANMWGKIKTVTQMFAVIFAFININSTNIFGNFLVQELTGLELIVNIITTILMIVASIATIISGYTYLKNGKKLLFSD